MAFMVARRLFIASAAVLLLLPRLGRAGPEETLVIYKGPHCGCCGGWEKHLRAAGFRVETRVTDDLPAVKRSLGSPVEFWTCHTGLIGGYIVQGHVPAADVRRLLLERPKARGIVVPGMPLGSPGMEQGPPSGYERYDTLAFDKNSSWAFARH